MNIIKREIDETKEILSRIKNKNFSGNEGRAIKNSSWQIATTLVGKIGSIIFTIIMARLMLPEIYGLYGLALSTIFLLGILSDMGANQTLVTFLSKTIDKKPGKAKGYFYLLTKYKLLLILPSVIMLLLLASWFADIYYNKPIYYALLAGSIYLPILIFSSYLDQIFLAKNNFRPQFIKEIIIQLAKLTILPFSIIYFLAKVSSVEIYLLWIFLILSFCYLIGGLYSLVLIKTKHPFQKKNAQKLDAKEKRELLQFMLPLSVTAISGMFFGHVDQIMLGHYVESQFLGFYQVAINLIGSASVIISFASVAIFPVLARLKNKQLERGFRKAKNITVMISIAAAIFTFFTAPYIIHTIYGEEYIMATNYLRILSFLLISFPLISLYTTYYTSQKKTLMISIFLIISTILNIVLNYIFINIGLKYSAFYAVVGVGASTIISRYFYLVGLVFWRDKK